MASPHAFVSLSEHKNLKDELQKFWDDFNPNTPTSCPSVDCSCSEVLIRGGNGPGSATAFNHFITSTTGVEFETLNGERPKVIPRKPVMSRRDARIMVVRGGILEFGDKIDAAHRCASAVHYCHKTEQGKVYEFRLKLIHAPDCRQFAKDGDLGTERMGSSSQGNDHKKRNRPDEVALLNVSTVIVDQDDAIVKKEEYSNYLAVGTSNIEVTKDIKQEEGERINEKVTVENMDSPKTKRAKIEMTEPF